MSVITPAYFLDTKNTNSSQGNEDVGEVCIANISPLERQKRLRFGIQQFVVTIVILVILIALDVNPLWRLPLLLLFWASAVGYFQARDKT
jgi:hypothetical protein